MAAAAAQSPLLLCPKGSCMEPSNAFPGSVGSLSSFFVCRNTADGTSTGASSWLPATELQPLPVSLRLVSTQPCAISSSGAQRRTAPCAPGYSRTGCRRGRWQIGAPCATECEQDSFSPIPAQRNLACRKEAQRGHGDHKPSRCWSD